MASPRVQHSAVPAWQRATCRPPPSGVSPRNAGKPRLQHGCGVGRCRLRRAVRSNGAYNLAIQAGGYAEFPAFVRQWKGKPTTLAPFAVTTGNIPVAAWAAVFRWLEYAEFRFRRSSARRVRLPSTGFPKCLDAHARGYGNPRRAVFLGSPLARARVAFQWCFTVNRRHASAESRNSRRY